MNKPLLVFREIEKSFSGSQILCGIDLSLYPGKCILLSGKNGVGKTTLLKIIAGLEIPDLAKIEISGKTDCWKKAVRSVRKEIIYLHQNPIMFSSTVELNVAYGLRFTSLNRKQRQESVEEALEWAGLTDVAKKQAKTLSGGVQQRVAFTRAWILKPKVLLLDEPMANMDHESREKTYQLLVRMKSAGMSLVITSHFMQYFEGIVDQHFQLRNCALELKSNLKVKD
ncbi:MAG: energy-coupling factor ABC transporter ATP-binding protein [Candidatus Lambdaproteobacteria bacterium]|jgi:ABC-type multidrug transport system ATPase subunit|nr:energy-coupling factor ABC transporter ATP-binding protein [Candidatus Lambdaproteobacteria bacterium]